VLIALSMLLIVESCANDSPECSTVNLPLNDDDFVFIPYSQFSKITFFDTKKNDTIVFDCFGVDTGHSIDHFNPEGCEKLVILGNKVWHFSSINSNDTISLIIEKSRRNIRNIFVCIGKEEFGFYNPSPIIEGKDQITIQGNTYDTIIKFQNYIHPEFPTRHYCYYNMKNGILKIERDSGNLELVRFTK
jgi:hypothetical protein